MQGCAATGGARGSEVGRGDFPSHRVAVFGRCLGCLSFSLISFRAFLELLAISNPKRIKPVRFLKPSGESERTVTE